jgi:hypothetical protein
LARIDSREALNASFEGAKTSDRVATSSTTTARAGPTSNSATGAAICNARAPIRLAAPSPDRSARRSG